MLPPLLPKKRSFFKMSFNEQKLLLKPKAPHFFKIILSQTIRQEKLEIPKVFIRKHGSNLQNSVFLKVSPNTMWKIGLTKSDDGTISLFNGWKQFAEYYSLDHGHLLVFKYRGNSRFRVTIFDTTASEIDYPYSSIRGDEHGLMDNEFEMEDSKGSASVEMLDDNHDFVPSRKRMQKNYLLPRNPRPRKCVRTNSENDNQTSPEFQCLLPRGNGKGDNGEGTSVQRLTANEKAICQEIASGFVSEYPSFVATISVSSVCGSRSPMVTISKTLPQKYFKKEKDSVILDFNGRTWPARYFRTSSCSPTRISLGWKEFAEDNQLQVGDLCAFELIDCDKRILRITIFRLRETEPEKSRVARIKPGYNCDRAGETPRLRHSESDISLPPFTAEEIKPNIHNSIVQSKGKSNRSETLGNLEAADRFTSEYTTHKLVIKPWNQERCSVNLPWMFFEKLVKQVSVKAPIQLTLVVDERTWPLTLSVYPKYKQGKLNGGWGVFSRDNSLQIGDACVLELIDEDNARVNVSIFKKR